MSHICASPEQCAHDTEQPPLRLYVRGARAPSTRTGPARMPGMGGCGQGPCRQHLPSCIIARARPVSPRLPTPEAARMMQ